MDFSRLDQEGRPLPTTMIDTDVYLHDGGFVGGRYFIVAANALDKLVATDSRDRDRDRDREDDAHIDVGVTPRPGRGVNWAHPTYGPPWASGNLGSPEMTVVGADPENHPAAAWEVVRQVELPYTRDAVR